MGLLDKWEHDKELKDLIRCKLDDDPSFKTAFTRDLTKQISDNLHKRMFGKKTDHAIIFIRGCPGLPLKGVGKSSCGLEICQKYDPNFTIKKVTFFDEELVQAVEEQAEIHEIGKEKAQFWLKDEDPKSLRGRAKYELNTLTDALRDSRICLVLIAPEMQDSRIADYIFEPILMSREMNLVRCAVYNQGISKYRGYFEIEIHYNSPLWNEYMPLKKKYQKLVIQRNTNKFDSEKYADKFLAKHSKDEFISLTKKGDPKLEQTRLQRFLMEDYPTLTNQERDFIKDTIKQKVLT